VRSGGRGGNEKGGDEYRPDPILVNMTPKDFDRETLRIVCELYEVDVVLLRSIGRDVPSCAEFVTPAATSSSSPNYGGMTTTNDEVPLM